MTCSSCRSEIDPHHRHYKVVKVDPRVLGQPAQIVERVCVGCYAVEFRDRHAVIGREQ